VVLAAAFAAIELVGFWPVLAGDDLIAYRDGFGVAGGALLAGAWLSLRDRRTGAADLVAVTPTAPWRLLLARLAGAAAAGALAFTAVFAGGLAVSAARGGHGTPDLRLLADGVLGVVLGGWVGMAVGRLGSRVAPLLLAPALVACSLLVASLPGVTDRRLSVQRLSPVLSVVGPAPSDRVATGFRGEPLASPGRAPAAPDDGLATSCAGDTSLSVCVYPPYGRRLASLAYQAMRPVAALFAGLPGLPTRARMVPVVNPGGELAACRGTEIQLTEVLGRYTAPAGPGTTEVRSPYAEAYLRCALPEGADVGGSVDVEANASDAVRLWALLAGGMVTRQELQRSLETGTASFLLPSQRSAEAALAMAELPDAQVRAELAPVWARLRAGTLPAAELPGQWP
jgi:hypothetical protein